MTQQSVAATIPDRVAAVRRLSNLIVLPHSVFALPFALASFLLAYRQGAIISEANSLSYLVVWVVGAVFFARTAAMAFNRVLDAEYDAKNPRTRMREIPLGVVTRKEAVVLVLAASAGFLMSSFQLGWHCFVLSPIVLAIVLGYSLTKRFTAYSHLALGVSLALAPGGAWWVLRPQIEAVPLLLMFAVLFWVAGFDILYSCQDTDFDRENRLHSIPAKFGIPAALKASRGLHMVTFALLVAVGFAAALPWIYFIGLVPAAILFIYQHCLVSADDLSRINRAFFTTNGWISVGYFVLCLVAFFSERVATGALSH